MKTEKQPNCWKVLACNRTSCSIFGPLEVCYPQGTKVHAPVGGLLAFATREDAQRFAENHYEIVPAYGEEPVALPNRALRPSLLSAASFHPSVRLVWEGPLSADSPWPLWALVNWPSGTVAYRKLTCLE